MRYKLLGRSGLRVSELCLGAMTFGENFGWGASEAESRKVFDLFVERGGNFIDTANHYTQGTSEEFVGRFVEDQRERFVLATKYTLYAKIGSDPFFACSPACPCVAPTDAARGRRVWRIRPPMKKGRLSPAPSLRSLA